MRKEGTKASMYMNHKLRPIIEESAEASDEVLQKKAAEKGSRKRPPKAVGRKPARIVEELKNL